MTTAEHDPITCQGLRPVLDRLTTESIQHSVDDTGGGTLCVRVDLTGEAWLWITEDGGYLVCRYEHDEDEGTTIAEAADLDQTVTAIRDQLPTT